MLEKRSHDCSPKSSARVTSKFQPSGVRTSRSIRKIRGFIGEIGGADVAVINHGETDGQIDERTGRTDGWTDGDGDRRMEDSQSVSRAEE